VICDVKDCRRRVFAFGYCQAHYRVVAEMLERAFPSDAPYLDSLYEEKFPGISRGKR
jgi:hypothetical protein